MLNVPLLLYNMEWNKLKKLFKHTRLILLIDILLIIILIISYKYILSTEINKKICIKDTLEFAEEINNPVFKIKQIILYSSAYAVDNSNGQKLQDIDISQFTDIAIYIDNSSEEITAKNTINELFIDNIEIKTKSESGEKIFNYKNPLNIGKYSEIENYRDDGILFNVIHTNEENENSDYNNNIFYTDCSNPISLGYINKNLITNCKLSSDGTISFDGSILKSANIDLEEINSEIKFTIHIVNNLNEDYYCDLKINNQLDSEDGGIYTGYIMKILNSEDGKYNFFKVNNKGRQL